MAEIFLGTSSWSEGSWSGGFYPPGMPRREWLRHYATRLPTVEADVTWYRVPSRSMVRGWAERTPPGFLIAAKFPRSVVHGGRDARPDPGRILRRDVVGKDAEAFLEAMDELGFRAGPLVLQFPWFGKEVFPDPGPFLELLDGFLDWLPARFRYAVEIRNPAWLRPDLSALLRTHAAALVLVEKRGLPHPADLWDRLDLFPADFVHARLIGDRARMDALTDVFDRRVLPRGESLERWAALLRELPARVSRAFVYANNHYEGYAPATVAALLELMGDEEGARRLLEPPAQGGLPFS